MSDEVQLTATRLYQVEENSPAFLSVIIGNANVGGSAIYFKDELISEENGEIDNLQIGKGDENIKHELLKCTTKVKDINPLTNTTFVTYKLKGGKKSEEFVFNIDVKQEGGYAIYSVTFVFV